MGKEISALIIEDEKSAINRLKKELNKLDDIDFHIITTLDSIRDSVEWLKRSKEHPELIFMDIQLTDGLSLEIFKQVEVRCPVIFTTAFDEYAIQAFKVNSIDYLLKPIDTDELADAIKRFLQQEKETQSIDFMDQIKHLAAEFKPTAYRSSFLVSFRQKMVLVDIHEVAYIYVKERGVFLKKKDGTEFVIDFFLDDLEKQLDPTQFYRANRQFLISRSSIREIEPYFNGRLILAVKPEAYTSVIISKEKATHFKRWADY